MTQSEEQLVCKFCGFKAKKVSSLKYHLNKVHKIEWRKYCELFDIPFPIAFCKMCGKEIPGDKQYCSSKCKHSDPELNSRRKRKLKNDPNKQSICNICGKILLDQINASGSLTKHLREDHGITDKDFSKYYTIQYIPIKEKFHCPYCDWTSNDLNNSSGWFTIHLREIHNLTPEEHIIKYPEHKNFWQLHFSQLDRKNFINESEENQITCLECGERMKTITNTHLKKHNLSKKQYKEKHFLSKLSSISTSNKLSINTSKYNEKMQGIWKENNMPMPWHRPEVFDQKVEENYKLFVEKFSNEFDCLFSIDEYRDNDPLKVICKKCGKESINYYRVLRCYYCSPVTKGFSEEEKELRKFIREELNLDFIENDRKLLKPKEIDIYFPELKLGIEYDGFYWHSERFKSDIAKSYHLDKTNECEKNGVRLIHIFEDEWMLKKEIVKTRLKQILGKTEKTIFARKCKIYEISSQEKDSFLSQIHIQGSSQSKINLGLFYENELISVMTFGYFRAALGNKLKDRIDTEYEMNRFASKYNVTGAAGKLLSYFIKKYHPTKIISFADRRWSQGKLYENLGFIKVSTTKPNYWYFTGNNLKRIHRFSFTKKTIIEKYGGNPLLSEWENMKLMGYNRIWDCGSYKFEKIISQV